MLRRLVLLLLACLGCAAALTACDGGKDVPGPVAPTSTTPRPRVFDAAAMGNDVKRVLTATYQLADVTAVSCPPDRPVADGVTFTCTATIAGTPRPVPITVLGTTGRYRVDAPR